MIIWISLAAVVVVIIVICLLALRFLRAEDADPFDQLPDEPRGPARNQDARGPARNQDAGTRDAGRLREPVAAGRRPSARPADDRVAAYRDRPTGPISADRRTGQGSGPARPVPAGARAAKSARPGETTDWDSLSDVDYWAEVASDKPLTPAVASAAAPAAAGPAAPGQARASRRRVAEPAADSRSADRGDSTAHLPVRQRRARPASPAGGRPADFGPPQPSGPRTAPGRYGPAAPEPVTQGIAALARLGSPAPAAPPPVSQPPASQPRPAVRPAPGPLDDDPLTSPSFPAINTSDSRSYGGRRPETQPGAIRPAPAYGEPTQQFSGYPAASDRASSPPNGYPAQPAVPAGNPYGSFVSQPAASYPQQAPAASQQDGSYPGYADNGQGRAAESWYGAPTPVTDPGQSQAMPAYAPAPPSYQLGADQAAGYYPGYQPGPQDAAYVQPGYPGAQYDQRGYGQDAAYGRDGYQGYPGYGNGGY